MSPRRVVAMLRRLVQELHRDHRSMALLFVAPVVLTGLMAFVLRGQQVAPVSAVLVNEAGPVATPIVTGIEAALRDQGGSAVEAVDRGQAEAALRAGTAGVAIVIPADFMARLYRGHPAEPDRDHARDRTDR